MTTPAIASLCPLCGGANQCAMAQGLPPEQCWCMTAAIPPEALAAIAPELRGRQCICPACARPRADKLPEDGPTTQRS